MRRRARDHRPSTYLHSAALLIGTAFACPAWALSELQPAEEGVQQEAPREAEPVERAPLPAPTQGEQIGSETGETQPGPEPVETEPEDSGGESVPQTPSLTQSGIDPEEPPADILHDLSLLPRPARRMHELIVEASKSGDIERLRPLIGTGESATQLSLADAPLDPITFLKNLSGDEQGQEILAILAEVLEAGFVHLEAGTPEEMYVWPYFFAVALEDLSAPQRVELFRIVTAGDYEEMRNYGTYIFYRVGITPEGRWSFFVAGE